MTNEADFELDEMQEIVDDFLVESDELVNSLDTNLVKLESSPGDLNLLNEIFRAAHTIKGTSSFLGFEHITTLTHRMEDILNKLRKAEMEVTAEIMDLMLKSLDILKDMLGTVRDTHADAEVDLTEIIASLTAALAEGGEAAVATPATETVAETSPQSEDEPEVDDSDEPADGVDAAQSELPAEPVESEAKAATDAGAKASATRARKPSGDQTIRVDVERLDILMNMMGELVLGRNSLLQTVNKLVTEHEGEYELEDLGRSANSVNLITTELQTAVMKMRMQPIGKVFNKFPRLVRDLARDSRKKIELVISGETTELDKSVIEEIGDPLVHIIRNSCDHGIESPEARTAAGKPETGTVQLTASQEGSNIVIQIDDDGKGFDVDAIRSKAVERGLVSRADVDRMPDKDVFHYIFEAGFSTAKVVTDVSGRGVGMDVVRTNIEKLNGMIDLDSEKGRGTRISIKLPLTLAIIQGLLVESDDEVFVIPLSSVHETVRTDQSDVYYLNKRPVFRLRDEIIPIINLNKILRQSQGGFILTEKPYIVVIGLADKKLGLVIDRFLGQEEVVIKSLGNYLGNTEGIAGATILGDGRIRLIVDLIGLFSIAKRIS
ncbi:MAG TPA: chemotaxis protein CheA [candidate division Zixibacteria bacterium]|nr:chemotaxis protein CheA [candidate division Zixibacteria bacterium]